MPKRESVLAGVEDPENRVWLDRVGVEGLGWKLVVFPTAMVEWLSREAVDPIQYPVEGAAWVQWVESPHFVEGGWTTLTAG
jgi:hypothetical protein